MTSWNDELLHNPHAVADKRRRVQEMFAAIAPSYDLNNRLHSLWMDQRWPVSYTHLHRGSLREKENIHAPMKSQAGRNV